jgi:hypothetical protein
VLNPLRQRGQAFFCRRTFPAETPMNPKHHESDNDQEEDFQPEFSLIGLELLHSSAKTNRSGLVFE